MFSQATQRLSVLAISLVFAAVAVTAAVPVLPIA